jgi:hypothetical protein
MAHPFHSVTKLWDAIQSRFGSSAPSLSDRWCQGDEQAPPPVILLLIAIANEGLL